MHRDPTPAILDPDAEEARGPVRLGRLDQIARLFGDDWARRPALVAAALALLERVPRVIVAPSLDALSDESDLIALVHPLSGDARATLTRPHPDATLIADLPADATPGEVLAAHKRGLRYAHPAGAVMLPGHRRPLPVSAAALALPLLAGRPALGPLTELHPRPLAPALVDAGVIALTTRAAPRSGPRIVLPPGVRPLRRPPAPDPETSAVATGPTAHLEAKLTELSRRFTHRLGRDRGALATLKREAERLLQAEVAAGAITGFALVVEPAGDDLAIEVAVTLPRRVGKVLIRVHQTA